MPSDEKLQDPPHTWGRVRFELIRTHQRSRDKVFGIKVNFSQFAISKIIVLGDCDSLNHEKSYVAYVSDRRDSTKRRMTLPFVSADRYDPEQVSTYLGYVLEPPRKFFLDTQSRTLDGETSIFEGN